MAGVEFRVKLEPEEKIGELCATRGSRKPGNLSDGSSAPSWEKGSSQSEGDLAGSTSGPRVVACTSGGRKGTLPAGLSPGVRKRRVKHVNGMEQLVLGVQDWGRGFFLLLPGNFSLGNLCQVP